MKKKKTQIIAEQEKEIKALKEALYLCLQYSTRPVGVMDNDGKCRMDCVSLQTRTNCYSNVPLQQIVEIAVSYPVWCELRKSEEWKCLVDFLKDSAEQKNLPVNIGQGCLTEMQENCSAIPIRKVILENRDEHRL